MNGARVCAFTSVCAEDLHYLPQYLAEVVRLGISFALHLDRCALTDLQCQGIANAGCCAGITQQNDMVKEFEEWDKQGVFDLVCDRGFDWALAWDVDETWGWDAPKVLGRLVGRGEDYFVCPWLNLWDVPWYVRVDPPFFGQRVKLYNLQNGRRWRFDHPITNGAKLLAKERSVVEGQLPLNCLHWGMLTHDLRLQHKARWDRIYSTALRGDANPYGFWKYALDPAVKPVLVEHGYFTIEHLQSLRGQ